MRDGSWLLGGLTHDYIVDSNFAVHVPQVFRENPKSLLLMGPGVAVYSALKKYRNPKKRDEHLGIVGTQMWGMVASIVASSMGFQVTLIDPLGLMSQCGAAVLSISKYVPLSEENLLLSRGSFDLIITQVTHTLDINIILDLTKSQGRLVLVGDDLSDMCEGMADVIPLPLIFSNRSVTGSSCASPKELKQILQNEKLLEKVPQVEMVSCDQVDQFLRHKSHFQSTAEKPIPNAVLVRVRDTMPDKPPL
eukprot:Blabericola_migrator_1__5224@NODE_268_length_10573_cov_173_829050_g224_i0_p7_GENE_NODE_268_length_10573_cov_173_829050_g224_i0NODE_268_length_10573_cov_173_829050_g224_i0_p7_ORF_typecomplete_len249_score30_62Glu_dehyd_C/PF16912_5/1_9e05ADH_zinc_N/PF00107_26/0_0014FAD_oxidored/PF12831_7/0_21_NODE_268_length_10573_cov_173_829050_g224_i089289674